MPVAPAVCQRHSECWQLTAVWLEQLDLRCHKHIVSRASPTLRYRIKAAEAALRAQSLRWGHWGQFSTGKDGDVVLWGPVWQAPGIVWTKRCEDGKKAGEGSEGSSAGIAVSKFESIPAPSSPFKSTYINSNGSVKRPAKLSLEAITRPRTGNKGNEGRATSAGMDIYVQCLVQVIILHCVLCLPSFRTSGKC